MSKFIKVQDGDLTFDLDTGNILANAPLFFQEQADANTDLTGYGQLWVDSDDSTLKFTDDGGTDYIVAGSLAGTIAPGTTDNSLARWDASSSRWQETTNFGIHEGDEKLAILWTSDAQLQWTTDPSNPAATVNAFVGYDTGNRLRISENLAGGDIGIYAAGNLLGLFDPDGDTLIRGEVTGLRLATGGSGNIRFQPGGADRGLFDSAGQLTLLGNGSQSGILRIHEGSSEFSSIADEQQIWVRDDVPNTLLATDDADNKFTLANTVSEIEYRYDSSTTAADPTAGLVRFDSVTIGSITEMYIDDLANTEEDSAWWLSNLTTGDVLTIRGAADVADYIVASVTSAPTDNTGWWTVPLTLIHTGTIFTNNDPLRISVQWIGSSGAAGSEVNDLSSAVTWTTENRVLTDINTATPPTTEAVTGFFEIRDNEDVDPLASLGFSASNELILKNHMHTSTDAISIRMEDASGAERTPFRIQNPGSNNILIQNSSMVFTVGTNGGIIVTSNDVELRYQSNRRLRTRAHGIEVSGDLTNAPSAGTTQDTYIDLYNDIGQELARIGFDNAASMDFYNLNQGANVRILATDSSAGLQTILDADPDTSTDLYGTGVKVKNIHGATVQTTDATQTEIISISVASGTTFGYRINIVGNESATGDTVFESIFGAIHNQAGTTAVVGSDIVDRTDDTGASTWTITVAADDTADALTVDVTGEAAHTIDWKVSVEILEV